MKNILLILLVILAVIMIVMGIRSGVLPPVITGVGFIIIAFLIYKSHG